MATLLDIRNRLSRKKREEELKKPFQPSDERRHSFFIVDDIFIDKYARHLGVYAVAVYSSLCRHVDTDQMCFPSINLIADQHGITTRSVIRAIHQLEVCNIIKVDKVRGRSNIYILTDKTEWKEAKIKWHHYENCRSGRGSEKVDAMTYVDKDWPNRIKGPA